MSTESSIQQHTRFFCWSFYKSVTVFEVINQFRKINQNLKIVTNDCFIKSYEPEHDCTKNHR